MVILVFIAVLRLSLVVEGGSYFSFGLVIAVGKLQ